MGGRASEEINLGEYTTGASNDLEQVSEIARRMVCEFGMSDKIGNVTLGIKRGPIFLGRDLMEEKNYSDDTAKLIDEEIHKIVDDCYARAKITLNNNNEKLKKLTAALLEKEVLDSDEVRKLLDLTLETDNPISNV